MQNLITTLSSIHDTNSHFLCSQELFKFSLSSGHNNIPQTTSEFPTLSVLKIQILPFTWKSFSSDTTNVPRLANLAYGHKLGSNNLKKYKHQLRTSRIFIQRFSLPPPPSISVHGNVCRLSLLQKKESHEVIHTCWVWEVLVLLISFCNNLGFNGWLELHPSNEHLRR